MTFTAASTGDLVRLVADHLWQSTIVAVWAAGLCLLLRGYAARVRHAIWQVASLKFVVPFALLSAIGGWLPWPAPRGAGMPPPAVTTMWTIGQPFSSPATAPPIERGIPAPPARATASSLAPFLVFVVWCAGMVIATARRWSAIRHAHAMRLAARPLDSGRVADAFARVAGSARGPRVGLRRSSQCSSPSVVGILRPVLLWPDGISDALTDGQLEAIVAHEFVHVRRRDNLASAAHALVEILFWFHPLVWWMGARLIDERERACDEDVLQSGAAPDVYAGSILKVCELSIGGPAIGTAGITGSTLTHRIEAIMSNQHPQSLGWLRRALLVAAAASLAAGPVAAGAINREAVQALTGSVAGIVTDPMGAVMTGATVTARSTSAGLARTAVTDELGRYAIVDLPAGVYEVRVTRNAFKSHIQSVVIRGGLQTTAHAEMALGALSEAIHLGQPSQFSPQDPPSADAEARLVARVAQSPDDISAHKELALLYYRQERFAESESAMARAAELIGRQAADARSNAAPDLSRGGTVREPRKIRDVKPTYPAAALAAQVTGIVIIEARIAEDGTVRDVRVLRGVPMLDEAAVGAVRQWPFTPTYLNGVPVEVVMTVTVGFGQ